MTALVPFDDIQRMGAALAKSGLFGMKSPEQAIALMLVAQAEGQHPATIAQDYDIIQGKATRKTHSVLARFQQAGGKVDWHALTAEKADATFSHPQGGSLRMEWTMDQARKAGLTGKDNWKNYPRAMLRARCIAEGVRAVYPAAIGGMLVAEEAQDMAPSAPSTPRPNAAPPQQAECPPALLQDATEAANKGMEAYEAFFKGIGSEKRMLLAGHHAELKGIAAQATASAAVVDVDFVEAMDAAEAQQ